MAVSGVFREAFLPTARIYSLYRLMGDPDEDPGFKAGPRQAEAGSRSDESGIPFSDPVAEGVRRSSGPIRGPRFRRV